MPLSKKSKKIILILILVILVAILHYKIIDTSRYTQIDKESDLIINESANVYMYYFQVYYYEDKTLRYFLGSNGTAEYIAGYSGILEYEKDGVWYSLKYKHPPISEQPISCTPDQIVSREFLSEWHYGKLRKGHYRFIRPIAEEGLDPYLISIEFDVE